MFSDKRKETLQTNYIEEELPMKLTDPIKTILLAGIGAAAITADKSKEMIDTLVKKGEITVEEGKALNQELKRKTAEKKKEKADDRLSDKINALSREEREDLRAKLDAADAAEAERAEEIVDAVKEAEAKEDAEAEDAEEKPAESAEE